MDESKLNKFVLKAAKDLMTAKRSLPLSVAVGVINFKMASLASHLRVQLDTRSGFGASPINLYQICFLNSGW